MSDDLTLRDSDQLNNSEQVQTNFQNGHQGFEVSDLYGNYSILINNDEVRVSRRQKSNQWNWKNERFDRLQEKNTII